MVAQKEQRAQYLWRLESPVRFEQWALLTNLPLISEVRSASRHPDRHRWDLKVAPVDDVDC